MHHAERTLAAENRLLHAALRDLGGHPLAVANLGPYLAEIAALRTLAADTRTALLAAGWREEDVLRRLHQAAEGQNLSAPLSP